MTKSVLLIGGRSKAQLLGAALLRQGYAVTVINKALDECHKMALTPGLVVINGDGTKPYVLEEAGAGSMDIAIALTSKDEDNLVACQLCKKHFGVGKTVSLVTDPGKLKFFYQMGVDRVVCAAAVLTNIIQQQAFVREMGEALGTGQTKLAMCEVKIPAASPVVNKNLAAIKLPQDIIVGCILRDEETLVPKGSTCIQDGDILVVIVPQGQQQTAIAALTGC